MKVLTMDPQTVAVMIEYLTSRQNAIGVILLKVMQCQGERANVRMIRVKCVTRRLVRGILVVEGDDDVAGIGHRVHAGDQQV